MSLLESDLDDTLSLIVARDGLSWEEVAKAAHRGIQRHRGRAVLENFLARAMRWAVENTSQERRAWGR